MEEDSCGDVDEPSHAVDESHSVSRERDPPRVERCCEQGVRSSQGRTVPLGSAASGIAVSMATCKGGGSICGLIRLSQIQSRAKMDFLMRLLAALKTQIEFKKRQTPPSENNLASEDPMGQGGQRRQHPVSLRSPWDGSRRVSRPHCGVVELSATEMSKPPTQKKAGSGDRAIPEGVPELAKPLGKDPHLHSKGAVQKS